MTLLELLLIGSLPVVGRFDRVTLCGGSFDRVTLGRGSFRWGDFGWWVILVRVTLGGG